MSALNKHNSKENFQTNTIEIVHRHLQDVNHKITEEEIRNIKIGASFDLDNRPSEMFEKSQGTRY